MKSKTTAVILSGGKNSRMNYNTKAFLEIAGSTFIEKILENLNGFKEIMISCNDLELYKKFKDRCTLVSDEIKDIGPIGGLYSIFKSTDADRVFIVAADMPFVNNSIINSICSIDFNADALVACADGREQPLFAVYKKSILANIEKLINLKIYKMKSLLKESEISYFYIDDKKYLSNINTPEEYKNLTVPKKPTIVNVVASCSNSGKTTLIEGIIKELKKKDYIISTIKHDVHGFDIDKKGKDTYKHRMAGADNVSISSKERFALIRELKSELTLEQIIKSMPNSDFIIVEGYKNSNLRKIEVFREGVSEKIITPKDILIAIATDDENLDSDVEIVNLNDYETIACLIERERFYVHTRNYNK